MCGIAGTFGRVELTRERTAATLRALARRGPDGQGSWSGRLRGCALTLLHTRLAIIDLDARADQPFAAEDCVLVFNGEIYNYLELRRELAALGHRFQTESDTEVLIHAYRAWGPECVTRFQGMWAFALFDRRDDVLMLSRDPFGEKPLYHMEAEGTLYFASEVKALQTLLGRRLSVNMEQVRRYLVNGYKALYKKPKTYFADIHEMPPASNAVVTDPANVRPNTYWRLDYRPAPMTQADAVDGVRQRLLRSLDIHMRADVPVAFCLSGGVDSGALACIAAKHFERPVSAFSVIDSDPRYDESDGIDAVVSSLGCRHHVTRTDPKGFFDRLASLVDYHDAPVATISYYVHAFLSQAIHEQGFKVALSGTGADELFTGYYDHYSFWLAEMHGRSPDFDNLLADWRNGYGATVRNPLLHEPLSFVTDPSRRDHIYLDRETFNGLMVAPLDEDFTEIDYTGNLLRNRMMNELRHESVPVILHEDDRNSMYWSVENRSPYLDCALAEFAYTVPNEHLIHAGWQKWPLRAAVEDLLPDAVRLEKRKRGFNVSITSLIDVDIPDTRERLLAPGPIFDVVDRDAMTGFLDADMTPNSHSKFLFSFVSAKLFLESNL
ncbi:MAG: asparagine synthase (glutamine-hydrolyzing), partial [Alphaproteobacteria bacterium]|nr:asparagine synthase (glutamine-hydrolyzing) [Alphaproteobacteria bacterium]